MKQGLGRLLRHRQDRGVLAVLDPRLRSMGYGRRFLASLPPAPVTQRLLDVARFFDSRTRPMPREPAIPRLSEASGGAELLDVRLGDAGPLHAAAARGRFV